jgi:hypothetical protein
MRGGIGYGGASVFVKQPDVGPRASGLHHVAKRKSNASRREAERRVELRRLRAAAREPRPVETVYIRTYVRRPKWARAITTVWLVTIGILIGGGMIPHVEDKPYLHGEAIAKRSVSVSKPPPAAPLAQPMSYSWVPEKGAESYKLAFFTEDGKLVKEFNTTEPNREVALPAGTYRWIVWAFVGGLAKSKAIVNSEVTTP